MMIPTIYFVQILLAMRLEFLALGLMENYWGLLNMQQHKFDSNFQTLPIAVVAHCPTM